MRKTIILLIALLLSVPIFAQLEVKQGSFKEVPGFVNINSDPNYQTDDNDLPFAVIKVRTENITDKQRRELKFGGNAGTFILLEYKDGEVWVYLTAKYAEYLKISHPDFSSIEFTIPFDLQPKKGYEMMLVNKVSNALIGWGSLSLETKPDNGATIKINDKEINQTTPFSNNMMPVGRYVITVSKVGFVDVTQEVLLTEGGNEKIVIEMPRDINYKAETMAIKVGDISFDMVLVEGGAFTMGATKEQSGLGGSNEKPTHTVFLDDYYIGACEVTQELWEAVVGNNPSEFRDNNNPVENVSYNDCQKFIKKLNKISGLRFRLPTEAEWEYAARGGKKSNACRYSGSNYIESIAWYDANSKATTNPVGLKQSNEIGVFDMSGNVWEWCSDKYGIYVSEKQNNPIGPPKGTEYVLRGGSWNHSNNSCRVSVRLRHKANYKNNNIGLRLALDK